MIFVASKDTIIPMLKNESVIKKNIITEIKKEINKKIELKEKEKKKFQIDKYFITFDLEKDLVSVIIHSKSEKAGKIIDSFKSTPDKVIGNILYGISNQHKKYLEKEIEKIKVCIKTGENYVQV